MHSNAPLTAEEASDGSCQRESQHEYGRQDGGCRAWKERDVEGNRGKEEGRREKAVVGTSGEILALYFILLIACRRSASPYAHVNASRSPPRVD